jgi:hypothetical protein
MGHEMLPDLVKILPWELGTLIMDETVRNMYRQGQICILLLPVPE